MRGCYQRQQFYADAILRASVPENAIFGSRRDACMNEYMKTCGKWKSVYEALETGYISRVARAKIVLVHRGEEGNILFAW